LPDIEESGKVTTYYIPDLTDKKKVFFLPFLPGKPV
jgi:hypothetical protein